MSSYPASPELAVPRSGRNAAISAPPLLMTDDLPHRPRPIDAAAGVMIATAVFGLIMSAVSVIALHDFNAAYRTAVAPIGASDEFVGQVETVVRASLALVATTALTVSITQVALASGVLRGNRGARFGAWALSALGATSAIAILLTMAVVRSNAPMDAPDATAAAVVQGAQVSIPRWSTGAVGLLALLQSLGFVAAAILLAAPSAAAFFGRVMRPWRPQA